MSLMSSGGKYAVLRFPKGYYADRLHCIPLFGVMWWITVVQQVFIHLRNVVHSVKTVTKLEPLLLEQNCSFATEPIGAQNQGPRFKLKKYF
jgi:hypothetical protein